MVDYTFYKTVYLGSAIAEKQFPGVAARAQAELARLKQTMRVQSSGAESERLALCAMAEAVYDSFRRGGVVSATTGSVFSVFNLVFILSVFIPPNRANRLTIVFCRSYLYYIT